MHRGRYDMIPKMGLWDDESGLVILKAAIPARASIMKMFSRFRPIVKLALCYRLNFGVPLLPTPCKQELIITHNNFFPGILDGTKVKVNERLSKMCLNVAGIIALRAWRGHIFSSQNYITEAQPTLFDFFAIRSPSQMTLQQACLLRNLTSFLYPFMVHLF